MKLKSFTLIEILIASAIFMAVAVSAAAAFAQVKKTNQKTDDLRISSDCATQVESFISSSVRSATGDDRIEGLVSDLSGKLAIEKLTGAQKKFSGIVLSEQGTLGNLAILRRDDGYYSDRASDETALLTDLNSASTKMALFNSNDCRPPTDSVDSLKVFSLQALDTTKSYPEGYSVKVDDAFYRILKEQNNFAVPESYAKISVDAVNTKRSL